MECIRKLNGVNGIMKTKPRILYLLKILLERTDEEHTLSTTQIIEILNDEYH